MTRLLMCVLGVTVLFVGACGGGGSTPQVASATGGAHRPAHAPATATQLIHTAAQCLRDHGAPTFPDPVLDTHGHLQVDDQLIKSLPAAVVQRVQQACRDQIGAAQAAANALQPPVTPQELAQATRFAQCVRQHGWPNFPDPDAQGKFESSTPGAMPPSKNDPSIQACRALLGTRGS